MKKRNLSPLLWLLLIPAQIGVGALLLRLGVWIDGAIFSNPGAEGHGMPVFSFMALLIAAAGTVIVAIVSVVLTVLGFRRRRREP